MVALDYQPDEVFLMNFVYKKNRVSNNNTYYAILINKPVSKWKINLLTIYSCYIYSN